MNILFLLKKSSLIISVFILLTAGMFSLVSSSMAVNRVRTGNLSLPIGADWWSMYRHDAAHSGISSDIAPVDDQILWSYNINNSIQSSPAVSHGCVYVCSWDWNIYCFEMDTGNLLWNYTTDNMITSSPAVANGKLYVGCQDTKLYCLDAVTGGFLWSFKTDFLIDSSPVVVDGKVFFGSSDGRLYCLDASDGTLIWSYQTSSVILSSPAVVDGRVYFGITYGGFLCLDSETGSVIWSYEMSDGIYSSPTIDEGKVYFGANDNNVYCLNSEDGSKVWNYTTISEVQCSPAVAYGIVYIGTSDGKLLALDKITGNYIWSYQINGSIKSAPAVSDGRVYFGTNPCCGFLSEFICLDALTGTVVWIFNLGTIVGMKSSPAISAGKVFACSGDGVVYAFGEIEFLADANGPYFSQVNDPVEFSGSVYGGQPGFSWLWDFSDGSTSIEQNPIHTYAQAGEYFVTLTVTDSTGNASSDGTQVSIKMPNRPPSIPEINGPNKGKKGVEYTYSFVSTDEDLDDIYYLVQWGDSCGSEDFVGPYLSGEIAYVNHTYGIKGEFTIYAKAIDTNDAESDWATLEVTMPRDRQSTALFHLFENLLESFPHAFQILRHLLNL